MKIEIKFDIGDAVKFENLISEKEMKPLMGHGKVARIHICSGNKIYYSVYNEIMDHAYFVPEEILEVH